MVRTQDELDNHANQLNPEHAAFYQSRGYGRESLNSSSSADDVWGDDSESFEEEWVPQEAW